MFWPGPLTLVVKANLDKIPMLITADTGYVGIRVPNHPIAIQLLKESGLPIAAPSANKFGHVSPTKAEHVYHDFH
jgi:tRNA A37 threonylcarbamoyladenosine synthetase subunit TsaC/SUA5/YrdC